MDTEWCVCVVRLIWTQSKYDTFWTLNSFTTPKWMDSNDLVVDVMDVVVVVVILTLNDDETHAPCPSPALWHQRVSKSLQTIRLAMNNATLNLIGRKICVI